MRIWGDDKENHILDFILCEKPVLPPTKPPAISSSKVQCWVRGVPWLKLSTKVNKLPVKMKAKSIILPHFGRKIFVRLHPKFSELFSGAWNQCCHLGWAVPRELLWFNVGGKAAASMKNKKIEKNDGRLWRFESIKHYVPINNALYTRVLLEIFCITSCLFLKLKSIA
jgi:hypothetical protein